MDSKKLIDHLIGKQFYDSNKHMNYEILYLRYNGFGQTFMEVKYEDGKTADLKFIDHLKDLEVILDKTGVDIEKTK